MSFFLDMFSYSFMIKAIIAGLLISICSALLGVNLVLKKYSMIGDGLSHVGFGALAIAATLNLAPLTVAIPLVLIVAFILLSNNNKVIKNDTFIALISASALAIGVTIISLSKGMNTDLYNYLFGSILAMNSSDFYLAVILSIIVIILYILFFNRIFTITFDENFAKATGVKTKYYNMLLAALTSITIVLGMRIMGSLLISALIIFPALIAMNISKSFKKVVILSAISSVICFLIGITLSFNLSTPTGASIVIINLIVLIIVSLIKNICIYLKNK